MNFDQSVENINSQTQKPKPKNFRPQTHLVTSVVLANGTRTLGNLSSMMALSWEAYDCTPFYNRKKCRHPFRFETNLRPFFQKKSLPHSFSPPVDGFGPGYATNL